MISDSKNLGLLGYLWVEFPKNKGKLTKKVKIYIGDHLEEGWKIYHNDINSICLVYKSEYFIPK
jgi:hypothetical protein